MFDVLAMLVIEVRVCQIASSSTSLKNHLGAHFASIIRLTDQEHEVNERFARIEPRRAELGRGIVVRERVMIVVKALAHGANAHKQVLGRVDRLVVGSVAPHVRGAIHQPGQVEQNDIAQNSRHEVCDRERFGPEVPRHYGRYDKADQNSQRIVVSEKFKK